MATSKKSSSAAQSKSRFRLRARHDHLINELHPEDKDGEEYDLDLTVNVLLPRVVRGGFILTLWSTFEVAALDLAQYAYPESGKSLDPDSFRYGCFLKNLDSVFTKGLGVPAFPDSTIRQRLDELRLFRNALIHHGGKIDKLPSTLQRATPEEYAAIGLHFYKDMRHKYVVPKAAFTHRSLDLVSEYILGLSERVYGTIHPVPLTDA